MEPGLTAKLALGTVQFGLDYGINNTRGRVPEAEVAAILDSSSAAGIHLLDTSSAYGAAEEVLGRVLAGRTDRFDIVSKLAKGPVDEIDDQIELTFHRLGLERLYGYLCHHFDFFLSHPFIWDRLCRLKEAGRVGKIGFSLYHPAELGSLFDRGIVPDLVQIPYSVLDRRFDSCLIECARRGIEVHVRSIFMQGLLLRAPEALPAYFLPLHAKVVAVHAAAAAAGVTVSQFLLIWTCSRPGVGRVVIGVDSHADLSANLAAAARVEHSRPYLTALDGLGEADERLILPVHWPL